MFSLNDFLTQFYQPYFFYSLFFLMLSFICIEVFLHFNRSISSKTRSILYLVPLFIPVFVLMLFEPKTAFLALQHPNVRTLTITADTGSGMIIGATSAFPFKSVVSVTGLLCIAGAVAAVSYFVVTLVFGQRIARKIFHVIPMSPEEYTSVQERVKEVSQKMGVSAPKVGLIEDLRPNAFTIGYGKSTMIVFSLGILNILDADELVAVISHELAHVKAGDFMFRSFAFTLNMLSFFNPLSYFAAASAQRERELLADEKAVRLLNQPQLMASVLAKLEKVLQGYPNDRFLDRLSSSLFLVSPLARKPDILAAHPQIANRIKNINVTQPKPRQKPRCRRPTVVLAAVLACTALLATYAAVQVEASFANGNPTFILRTSGASNQQAGVIVGGASVTLPTQSLPSTQTLPALPNSSPTLSSGEAQPVQIIGQAALP